MSDLKTTAPKLHRYQWATTAEKKVLFNVLARDRSVNQLHYKKRFVQGANQKRPAHLRYSHPLVQEEGPLLPRTVFHEGLLKDEAGVYWIVKTFNPQAQEDQEPRTARNSPPHERLAYLLAEGRANYTEIRLCPERHKDGYLSRVATASNLDVLHLPHKSAAEAFAAILVANVFMRKWDQHLDNFAYVGEIPVSVDHDVMGSPATFPQSPAGVTSFTLALLSFKLVATMSRLRPAHELDTQVKERFKYHFVRQNHREAWDIMRDLIHGMGLGSALVNAEGLETPILRKSILAFKSLRAIDHLADQAGFHDQECDAITRYLTRSQKTLGSDVGHLWHRLTGENARFDQLD